LHLSVQLDIGLNIGLDTAKILNKKIRPMISQGADLA